MNAPPKGIVVSALLVLATAAPAQDGLKVGDVVWAQWKPKDTVGLDELRLIGK